MKKSVPGSKVWVVPDCYLPSQSTGDMPSHESTCVLNLGARMTGAGFGGCTVNLVLADAAEAFVKNVRKEYQGALGLKGDIYVCRASDGALAA